MHLRVSVSVYKRVYIAYICVSANNAITNKKFGLIYIHLKSRVFASSYDPLMYIGKIIHQILIIRNADIHMIMNVYM